MCVEVTSSEFIYNAKDVTLTSENEMRLCWEKYQRDEEKRLAAHNAVDRKALWMECRKENERRDFERIS